MEPLHRVQYDLRDEDVVALHKRMLRNSPLVKDAYRRKLVNVAIAWLVVVAGFAGGSYALAATHAVGMRRAVLWIAFYVLITPVFVWRALTPRAFLKRADRLVERGVRTGTIPVTRGPAEVYIYDNEVLLVESDGTVAKPWSATKSVTDEPDGVYFEFADGVQMRVPGRAFVDSAARAAFAECARERMRAMASA